jgi:hypothetical protein
VNPGVCLPGRNKKVGARCKPVGSTVPMHCDGQGACVPN